MLLSQVFFLLFLLRFGCLAGLELEWLLHHDDLGRVRPLRVILQMLMRPLPLPLVLLRN